MLSISYHIASSYLIGSIFVQMRRSIHLQVHDFTAPCHVEHEERVAKKFAPSKVNRSSNASYAAILQARQNGKHVWLEAITIQMP